MPTRSLIVTATCLVILSCGGGGGAGGDTAANASAAGQDRNACHLLTHDEVSALVGQPITMADQSEAGDTWSTCDWEDAGGTFAFGLTAYWSGGKAHWEAWRTAQALGERVMQEAEGVSIDSVVQQGPVAGIGDAAYFSELLPSLVLKGDVLFELKMALVPDAGRKFAGLAKKLLDKTG